MDIRGKAQEAITVIERETRNLALKIEERETIYSRNQEYLSIGGRPPAALMDAEMALLEDLPAYDEAGKPLSEAAKERLLKLARQKDETYQQAKTNCQHRQRLLGQKDADIEAAKVQLSSAKALLAYYTALINSGD